MSLPIASLRHTYACRLTLRSIADGIVHPPGRGATAHELGPGEGVEHESARGVEIALDVNRAVVWRRNLEAVGEKPHGHSFHRRREGFSRRGLLRVSSSSTSSRRETFASQNSRYCSSQALGFGEPLGLEPAGPPLRDAIPGDQPGPLEHLEMFGDRRLRRQAERRDELVHGGVARARRARIRAGSGGQGSERALSRSAEATMQFLYN